MKYILLVFILCIVSCGKVKQLYKSKNISLEAQPVLKLNEMSYLDVSSSVQAIALKTTDDKLNELVQIEFDGTFNKVKSDSIKINKIHQFKSSVGVDYSVLEKCKENENCLKKKILSGYNLYFGDGEKFQITNYSSDIDEKITPIHESEDGYIVFNDLTIVNLNTKKSYKITTSVNVSNKKSVVGHLVHIRDSKTAANIFLDFVTLKRWFANGFEIRAYLGDNKYLVGNSDEDMPQSASGKYQMFDATSGTFHELDKDLIDLDIQYFIYEYRNFLFYSSMKNVNPSYGSTKPFIYDFSKKKVYNVPDNTLNYEIRTFADKGIDFYEDFIVKIEKGSIRKCKIVNVIDCVSIIKERNITKLFVKNKNLFFMIEDPEGNILHYEYNLETNDTRFIKLESGVTAVGVLN